MRRKLNYLGVVLALMLGLQANAQQRFTNYVGDRIEKADVQAKRQRVPNIINKLLYDEYAPAISPDGKTLVYQSNESGKKWNVYKLWQADKDSAGFWQKPTAIESINAAINEGNSIGGPALSYDGSVLFFHGEIDGGKGSNDIYFSARTKDAKGKWGEWSKPTPVNGAVNTDNDEGYPSVSSDGSRLYFTKKPASDNDTTKTNRKGTQCYKLMVAKLDVNGTWGTPEELPTPVNGQCDKFVRVMPDNQSVFFSSTRGGGSPKDSDDFDLYWSDLQPDGKWSEPQPTDFAPLVKTTTYSYQPDMLVSVAPHDEPHVLAYFSAYMGASHEIFTIPLPDRFGPKYHCQFRGVVVDSVDGKPLEAVITQTNNTRNWLSWDYKNDKNKAFREYKGGAFSSILTETNKYSFVVKVPGYEDYKFVVDYTTRETGYCERIVRMKKKGILANVNIVDGITEEAVDAPLTIKNTKGEVAKEVIKKAAGKYAATLDIDKYVATAAKTGDYEEANEEIDLSGKKYGDEVNVLIKMYNIPIPNFGNVNFNTARPNAMAPKELAVAISQIAKSVQVCDDVFKYMKDYPMVKMKIEAHTDSDGGDQYNMGLSQRRSEAVKKYLVDKGIPADRLVIEYFGESAPTVPNDNANNKALNRRVEFKPILPTRK